MPTHRIDMRETPSRIFVALLCEAIWCNLDGELEIRFICLSNMCDCESSLSDVIVGFTLYTGEQLQINNLMNN